MVVQFRAISKRSTQRLDKLFEDKAAMMRAEIASRIAKDIVDASPVDTGTYIMAHVAGTGATSEDASRTSAGKARGRNASQFKNLALGNLRRSVSAAAIRASSEIWFRNRAEHALEVEYLGWAGKDAYHVYQIAGNRAGVHIRDVSREMGYSPR